ncbi:MAG TPA: hypothetical protein VG345_14210, partial [Bryobacteraceae bacterium]|nr:hypothetical protein [Bryobacteraceae bacterium]
MKRALRVAIPIAALAIASAGVILWYASSGRLSERLRERLIGEVERATGGRAGIRHFAFDWRTMAAEIDHAVVHGTEPAGSAPLFSADRIVVQFRIRSFLERKIDLLRVAVDRPEIHVIVAADGSTNVPRPRTGAQSGIQQILDLAIGSFDARSGMILAESGGRSQFQPWSAKGRNLRAQFNYEAAGPRYTGAIAVASVRVAAGDFGSFDL